MRVLVVGAGAVGSVLGGFLARSGHDITLLGRAWHLDAVRHEGLRISGLWGEHRVTKLSLAVRPEDVAAEPTFDWIFVCVKSHQTAGAVAQLSAWLGPKTLVCAFQNGLGNYELLLQVVPGERLALGRVIFGAELEPGHVRVTVSADEVLIGSPDARFPGERSAALAAEFQESGVPALATVTIFTALWAKMLYNCALNGLSALLEAPYGKLLEQPAAKRLMGAVIEEAYRVAAGRGIRLEPSDAGAYLAMLFTRLIPDTAGHDSSMLQDLRRGRVTEIESLNGAIVRLGREVGVPTPVNALVARLVHAKERFAGVTV